MLDLAEDYRIIDDPITVLYYRKTTRTAPSAVVSVPWVFKEDFSQSTLGTAEMFTNKNGIFHLWRTPLNQAGITQSPKTGDVIEHQSFRYTVDTVEYLDRDTNGVQRYRCSCTRE